MSAETLKSLVKENLANRLNLSPEEVERYLAMPIDEQRQFIEQRTGKKLVVGTCQPKILSRDEVNRMVDDALR